MIILLKFLAFFQFMHFSFLLLANQLKHANHVTHLILKMKLNYQGLASFLVTKAVLNYEFDSSYLQIQEYKSSYTGFLNK
jgi:hypothetical protein